MLRLGDKAAPAGLCRLQGLINTWAVGQADQLATRQAAQAWLTAQHLWTTAKPPTNAELLTLTRFRFHLRRHLLQPHEAKHADRLNQLLAGSRLQPGFAPGSYTLTATGQPIDRVLGTFAAILAEHHHNGTLARLKCCPECGWCYFDTTKNRSGKWCSMQSCGSRLKTKRYRERLAKQSDGKQSDSKQSDSKLSVNKKSASK